MRFCATLLLMLALCGACFANDQSKLSPELRNKKIIVVDKAMFIGNHLFNSISIRKLISVYGSAVIRR